VPERKAEEVVVVVDAAGSAVGAVAGDEAEAVGAVGVVVAVMATGAGDRVRTTEPKELLANEEPIELEGTVSTVLPGTMFRVKLDNEHEVLAHLSGKMRKHFVRLTVGDRVRLEMSPYDLSKARITYRLK
jgi:translation initiation factor IF-1